MMAPVAKASVVILHSIHYAVAARYEVGRCRYSQSRVKRHRSRLPRIQEIADQNGVSIVENPALARSTPPTESTKMPPEHEKAVAEIIDSAFRQKAKMKPQAQRIL